MVDKISKEELHEDDDEEVFEALEEDDEDEGLSL